MGHPARLQRSSSALGPWQWRTLEARTRRRRPTSHVTGHGPQGPQFSQQFTWNNPISLGFHCYLAIDITLNLVDGWLSDNGC